MKERTKITLISGGIILLVIGVISLSYAFLSVTKKQSLANTFTSGCLNISIESESNAINLVNAYPITDIEGLETEGYTFTIKNTCNTSTNYMINLENLNSTSNTLNSAYIKTSLSSDTMDNIITKLNNNETTTPTIANAYEAYNLYKGTINGNTTKEFNLKLWMDYDTTKEQGASKVYTSKINVIANPDLEITTTPEIKTTLVDNKLQGTITGSASTAKYCTTNDNICTPNTSTNITSNKVNINMSGIKRTETVALAFGNIEVNIGGKSLICTALNNGKTYCSNPVETTADPDFSKTATTDEGVFKTSDGMYGGDSYYWRGAATTNHVIFANKCWRIVRINGDKTMRLIYNGDVQSGNTCTGNGSNSSAVIMGSTDAEKYYATSDGRYNNSSYVGWTYSLGSQRTLSGTASNAKTQTEKWYSSNITGTNAEKVADGKFCNDRNVQSGSTWVATGTSFNYAGYKRLYTDYNPTFSCNSGDTYTLKVGAITADEVEFAGGKNADNKSYYLYIGQYYWTMSPSRWNGTFADVFIVNSSGVLNVAYVYNSTRGLRPVINLKADTKFATGGEGTTSKPYVVI